MGLNILKEIIEGIDAGIDLAKKQLLNRPDANAYANAIGAIQKASIRTRVFIQREGYVANLELSDLWIDAMKKVIIADLGEGLHKYLIDKAKFWGDPQLWLANPNSLKLVPKLNDLDQKCEMLLMQLKK